MRIAVIPAKRFSRRVPKKNWRPFCGKPMLAYPIIAAQASGLFDQIVVSTEDGQSVGPLAKSLGARVVYRPLRMNNSCWGTQEVCGYTLQQIGVDDAEVCCIYPATPLLTDTDLVMGYEALTMSVRYAYVNGWFYWGSAKSFIHSPELDNSLCLDEKIGDRLIDINTQDDWERAKMMYMERNGVSA